MADKYDNPWPKYRVYPPSILSPMRAVRHFCLDCCCESIQEVSLCPANTCPMWPYRFGKYPEDHVGPKTVLQTIRKKCKDCMPESFKRGQVPVRDCEKKCCPVWPYRMGTNPKRQGKGGAPPKQFQYGAQTQVNDIELVDPTGGKG
jgi:hypothetical protein